MLINANNKSINIMFGSGLSSAKKYEELLPLIQTAIEKGIIAFDTAPSYRTEAVLGKCLRQCLAEFSMSREDLFIQTKIDALQMAEGGEKVGTYIESAIRDLGAEYLDAVCIHWPVPEYLETTWKAFLRAREKGLVRYIGICNVRMRQLCAFPISGVMPDILQIECHPLRTCKRELKFCKTNGIDVQAYSPLCKMHKDIASNEAISGIADAHEKSIGQVVLRWHMDSGVIPIFTSKKKCRIEEYAMLSDFSLDTEEIKTIDSLNRNYKLYLESCACPGF